jgi:hypothetical protein
MAKRAKYVTVEGQMAWGKLFESTKDNAEWHKDCGGQFSVDWYPATKEDLEKYLEAGAPTESMGHKMIKEPGDSKYNGFDEYGFDGTYVTFKRKNIHKSGIEDFGGPPVVFDFREGESTKIWDEEADGSKFWNGTKAKFKVSIYDPFNDPTRASVRLESVAILELGEEPEVKDKASFS